MFSVCYNCCIKSSKIRRDLQRISKIKPHISQYNRKDLDFPSYQNDWKKFEQNKIIAFNILFVLYNTKKIRLAYKSTYNNEREIQGTLLMITDNKKWHDLPLTSEPIFYNGKFFNHPVKSLSRLLRTMTSNLYCLNCFSFHSTENRLKEPEE